MGRKASFLANSPAIGKKNSESGEPGPALPQTPGSYAEGPYVRRETGETLAFVLVREMIHSIWSMSDRP